jgi:opacity protein-like surface antigen
MKKIFAACTAAAALVAAAAPANAAVIVVNLGEYNGDGTNGPANVGTFNYVIPVGQTIVSALFESSFGNSVVDSSSTGTVSLDGITVGACAGPGNPCWDGPGAAISYSFLASEFAALADGSANLVYNQTDCCVIRLGKSTLTITTRGGVPEPAAWAMMLAGFGLVGGAMRKRAPKVAYAAA